MNESQFDLDLGMQAKIHGILQVAFNGDQFVQTMRKVAIEIAKKNGSVSCDDLRKLAIKHAIKPHHPNAWGSIFKTNDFKIVGFKKSELVSNHARRILIWGLKRDN